jgi:hypothetical protein
LTDLELSNSGSYDVIVSDSLGAVTSAVAIVTVGIPPSITQQPTGLTGKLPGEDTAFSVVATGTDPFSDFSFSDKMPTRRSGRPRCESS